MKKVFIKTPGKMIIYGDQPVLRSPATIMVEDSQIEFFKLYLKSVGVNDYEISEGDNLETTNRKNKRGLKSVTTGLRTGNLSLKIK